MFNYKKGQIAIWVILAIALVASMILFFLFETKIESIDINEEFNPESYIDDCVVESVNEAVDLMLPKGGFIEDENTILYNEINVNYLCKNTGNYLPCVNQHPLFINELKEEIKKYVQPRIDLCFNNFRNEVEKRNGNVEYGESKVKVDFATNIIYLKIIKDVTIKKDKNARNFDEFNVEIKNSIYDLANVAIEIANQEAKYCYFEYAGYMILHSKFDIRKNIMSDSTKIYTIKDKQTKKEMNIAIRSCAIPSGI